MAVRATEKYHLQLRLIRKRLRIEADKIVKQHKKEIIDFIRENQLYQKGIDGTGRKLQMYTPYTIAIKKLKGEAYDRTTLLDTGDFYDDMTVHLKGDTLIVFSTNYKTPQLIEKYGQDIFTFTVENLLYIDEEILEKKLIKWVLSQLEV